MPPLPRARRASAGPTRGDRAPDLYASQLALRARCCALANQHAAPLRLVAVEI